jgi:uncharacterized membrane protein YhaH (DUF805 family)
MILVNAWKNAVLENYANFSGRANRPQYWWFTLTAIIISVVLQVLTNAASIFGLIAVIYSLAVLIPSIALAVRRLHDINKSGWWLLITFIPIIGFIILIVWAATRGTEGENDHGAPSFWPA